MIQIKALKPSTGMLRRWMEELAALDFDVRHWLGQLKTNADAPYPQQRKSRSRLSM
ncbi:MAG: hypothetical protein GY696_16670 [Gammaproteobacteria bacterium]|nr:hypothetical protein [Gammaproteobacteria bacterium]